ncbi:serine/threonine-protein kinase pim-2-like [Gasterosteus aculeatus]
MWARLSAFFGHHKADNVPATKRARDEDTQEEEARGALDHSHVDSTSASADTVVGRRGVKRKVTAAEGGPMRKRKRRLVTEDSEDSEHSEEEAKQRGWLSYFPFFGHRKRARGCDNASVDGPRKKRKRRLDDEDDEDGEDSEDDEDDKDGEEETKQKEFEAKYIELDHIGARGRASVYAGLRRDDNVPVAIKHIRNENVYCTHVDDKGNVIPTEVAVMLKLAAESDGTSSHVSLLDWYQLVGELVLVMERPMPAENYNNYLPYNKFYVKNEEDVKIILRQLVDAALDLESKNVFHRDIKAENMLIETRSDFPRVRLISFGVSCFDDKRQTYEDFYDLKTPEFYLENGYRAGPTTVFQIGVVLYNALHMRKRFNTLAFIQGFQSLPPKTSKSCKDFLLMCLRVNPNNRPTLEQLRNHQWLR